MHFQTRANVYVTDYVLRNEQVSGAFHSRQLEEPEEFSIVLGLVCSAKALEESIYDVFRHVHVVLHRGGLQNVFT